ncbi:MAG: cell division protein ZapE [Pseudomonadota bacterium]
MSIVRDAYDARVVSHRLTRDAAQVAVLASFERITAEMSRTARFGLFRGKPPPVAGLYLWGGVGRGKSMLMDLFFETSIERRKRRVHFHMFMQEIHATLHEARKSGVDDAIVPVARTVIAGTRLLCLDEIQIADITDAMIMGRLFERLFMAGVVVVVTANRAPEDLYEDGVNRHLFMPFVTLLKERMEVRALTGPTDYRRLRTATAQRYFTPIDAAARAAVERLWQELTGGVSERLTLSVKGRDVVIPAFRDGIGRATFRDLCAQPLGPGDYLAVAAAVKTLILEDIPRLERSNFDQARRFVILIDALYEAGVCLICTAASLPDALYVSGEGTFEFERAASRLIEMQGWDSAL